ncbi:CRISPR system precrRNA processing endoribonuclease RAMP protein Cas6 [candidate division KSB1 bacterium]
MRKYNQVPHPFIIEPLTNGKTVYKKNDLLRFKVILIGKAIQFYPYFIYSFRELGKRGIGKERGHYTLERVLSENIDGEKREIFHHDSTELQKPFKEISADKLLEKPIELPDTITCYFVSPTRIQYNGKIATQIDFHVLFRNLLRRLSLLSYFHCDTKLDEDFAGLIDKATSIKTVSHDIDRHGWTRFSNRQQRKMDLGGIIGSVVYQGDFKEFLPYLLAGQFTHVGKNATFGLGKYILDF